MECLGDEVPTPALAASEQPLHHPSEAGHGRRRAATWAGGKKRAVQAPGSNRMQLAGGTTKWRSSKVCQHQVINRQVTMAAELGSLPKLLRVINMHLADMNGLNLITALHRVAKLSKSNGDVEENVRYLTQDPLFLRLYKTVVQHIMNHSLLHEVNTPSGGENETDTLTKSLASPSPPDGFEMPVQCMSMVVWSCATMRLQNRPLFVTIAQIVSPRIGCLKSFELSNLLWAYAKLGAVPTELFKSAGRRLCRSRESGEFTSQCLATIAWSFATAERHAPAVFQTLAQVIKVKADTMKTQEISNTLWAFAKIHHVDLELFHTLGYTAIWKAKIANFKSQELSNTVWAFATVGVQHPDLFAEVEVVAIAKRFDMCPQNIANVLWSYTKLQVYPQSDMFTALLDVAVQTLSQYKRQELSTVVWAASQMCPGHASFFGATMRFCCSRLKHFSPDAIANLTKDLASVDTDAPELFGVILGEAVRRISQYEHGALCIVLRAALIASRNMAIAEHTVHLKEMLSAICDHLAPRVQKLRRSDRQDILVMIGAQGTVGAERLEAALWQAQNQRREARQERVHALGVGELELSLSSQTRPSPCEGECEVGSHSLCTEPTYSSWIDSALETSRGFEGLPPGAWQEPQSSCTRDVDLGAPQVLPDWSWPPPPAQLLSGPVNAPSCRSWTQGPLRPASVQLPGDTWPSEASSFGPEFDFVPAVATAPAVAWHEHASVARMGWDPFGPPAELAGGAGGQSPVLPDTALPATAGRNAWTSSRKPEMAEAHLSKTDVEEKDDAKKKPALRAFAASCLMEAGPNRACRLLDITAHAHLAVVGLGEHVVSLRHGLLDMRVVLKSVPANLHLTADPNEEFPHVLRPIAWIRAEEEEDEEASGQAPLTSTAGPQGTCHLAYLHCRHGCLAEWATDREAGGRPVKPAEASRVVQGLLVAWRILASSGPGITDAFRADEIFIDGNEEPLVRMPLLDRPAGWGDELKWLSPEEASGSVGSSTVKSDVELWPAISFRLGLLLYCLGSKHFGDPHPEKTGEMVLMGLLGEACGKGPALRPDLDDYEGPEILRRLVAACLRLGGQEPPTCRAMDEVLRTVAVSSQE